MKRMTRTMTHCTNGRTRATPWRTAQGLALAVVLAAAVVAATGPAVADPATCRQELGCADPRGCPDIVVDRQGMIEWRVIFQTFPSTDCAVVEGHVAPGTRRLLVFPTVLANVGDGDLKIGSPIQHPELYTYEECHGHYHLVEYADYRLWEPQAFQQWKALRMATPGTCSTRLLETHPELADRMLSGRKQGFCVIDIDPVCDGAGDWQYGSCSSNQGISVGWSDIYDTSIEGQWIDITNLPSGDYVFEVEVNPSRHLQEVDYLNNAAAIAVRID